MGSGEEKARLLRGGWYRQKVNDGGDCFFLILFPRKLGSGGFWGYEFGIRNNELAVEWSVGLKWREECQHWFAVGDFALFLVQA